MTRTALVIRHVPFEDLGILGPLLTEHGYRVRFLEAGVESLTNATAASADLLIVLGGPIGVGDAAAYPFLHDEIAAIRVQIAGERPVLGICLGAQLIASALDASVTPTGRVEIGYAPLTLTAEGADSVLAPLGAGLDAVPVLHWHGDQFDIPCGAVRLAETPGFPSQAFAVGTRILGLQFHLEADHTQIERWLIGHAHELAANGVDPVLIREDARRYGARLAQRAQQVFSAWLAALDADPA